jgi:energy-coupling factor transport system substrate-specific component
MNILEQRQRFVRLLTFSAVCLALNVGLGKISNILGLPFTMDTIGTILGASILPWYYVILVAVLSSIVTSVVINPVFLYFVGTQLAIGVAALAFVKIGAFSKLYQSILAGLAIGIISAIVSSPVIATVFGGVTIPSLTALNVLFLASGKGLWESVIRGALIVESVDKVAAGIFVYFILRRLRIRA